MKYTNQNCQLCNTKLFEEDDIVICPECGAPYHRECYASAGRCVYEDKHADGFEFKVEREEAEDKSKICLRCGSDNPSDADKCKVCGYPALQDKKQDREYYKKDDSGFQEHQNMGAGFFGADGFGKINGFSYDPMGGVPKNSTIDGEAAADVATVVGQNTAYYMPRFKKLSDNKKKADWNWIAFLFPHFWFFLRKCYLQGAAALMINVALRLIMGFSGDRMIELLGLSYDQLSMSNLMNAINAGMQDPELSSKLITLTLMSFAATVILAAVNALWGVFANYIYKQRTVDIVRAKNQKAKEENFSDNERIMLLGKSGGTNIVLAVIVLLFTSEIITFIYQFIV